MFPVQHRQQGSVGSIYSFSCRRKQQLKILQQQKRCCFSIARTAAVAALSLHSKSVFLLVDATTAFLGRSSSRNKNDDYYRNGAFSGTFHSKLSTSTLLFGLLDDSCYARSVTTTTTNNSRRRTRRRMKQQDPLHIRYFSALTAKNSDNNINAIQSNIPDKTTTSKQTLTISSKNINVYDSFTSFLKENENKYDAYILDQFGVLHDGQNALDGAIECIRTLFKLNKQLIILSNTSAPSKDALQKLPKFGFTIEHFTAGAVTSGEEASQFIKQVYGSTNNNTNKKKALFFTWDVSKGSNPRITATPKQFLDQCGNIGIASTIDEADFIICHGSEVWYRGRYNEDNEVDVYDTSANANVPLDDYIHTGNTCPGTMIDTILQQCYQQRLPLVCANPDFVVLNPTSTNNEGNLSSNDSKRLSYMPGGIVRRYQEIISENNSSNINNNNHDDSSAKTDQQQRSPDIYMFGKPDVKHFIACLKRLGYDNDDIEKMQQQQIPLRVCHVGDSLHHDITGANHAGIDSILITSGIHSNDLTVSSTYGEQPVVGKIEEFLRKQHDKKLLEMQQEESKTDDDRRRTNNNIIVPTHIIPAFRL